MRGQHLLQSILLVLFLPVALGLACSKQDSNMCWSEAQCKPGYTCSADRHCVRDVDGGADGLVAVDSHETLDLVATGLDGPAPAATDEPGGVAPGLDSAGSPEAALPDAAVSTPEVDGSGGTGGDSGGPDAAVSAPGIDAAGGAAGDSGAPDAVVDLTAASPDAFLRLALGAACAVSSECAAGNCVDGVCCDRVCTGCNACQQAFTGSPDGICSPVIIGQDPHNACADETATKPCGNDGACDGVGACRKVSSGHICLPASCSGSTFTPAATCDGAGNCPASSPQDCGSFQCSLTGCLRI